uniref:Serine hydrolase like n=1 Tax=Mastacembelus armatus TaxID=205130 RepID=A0A3Q3RP27_9TELE
MKILRVLKNIHHAAGYVRKCAVCILVTTEAGKKCEPDAKFHPVLCLHGWADNCGTFNTLIPKECRYVALDMAGQGRSSHRRPGDFYSLPAYVADVHRVAFKNFSIIGHSMGEYTIKFTALYPEMVNALVLLYAYGFLLTDLTEIPKVMRQGMDEMLQFEQKREQINRVYTYETAVERLLAANSSLSERSVHILLERGLVEVEGEVAIEFLTGLLNKILEIKCTLNIFKIYFFRSDQGFSRSFYESAQKTFTSALLLCFQGINVMLTVQGDHHIHLNNPEVVAPFVSDFLRTKLLLQLHEQKHKLPA